MISKQPVLTIAIPTYNRKDFLKECLDHVIPQVDDDIEVIVCDNASEDGTYEFMEEVCNKYNFIRYIKNEKNIGPDGNFLKCLREGEGKFIHILSDDDILLDRSINKIKECILNCEEISFIYLNSTGFEGDFELSKCKKSVLDLNEDMYFENKNLFIEYIGIYATFISAMIFNKDLFRCIDNPEQYLDTYLFQTHILFKLISMKGKILVISKSCIAARGGNGGGYNLYKVFAYYWKKVLFDTGLKSGFSNQTLKKVYGNTIKIFLRNWTIHMKISNTKYDSTGYGLVFRETYKYPAAWLYLYPFIIMPSSIIYILKKIHKKVK